MILLVVLSLVNLVSCGESVDDVETADPLAIDSTEGQTPDGIDTLYPDGIDSTLVALLLNYDRDIRARGFEYPSSHPVLSLSFRPGDGESFDYQPGAGACYVFMTPFTHIVIDSSFFLGYGRVDDLFIQVRESPTGSGCSDDFIDPGQLNQQPGEGDDALFVGPDPDLGYYEGPVRVYRIVTPDSLVLTMDAPTH